MIGFILRHYMADNDICICSNISKFEQLQPEGIYEVTFAKGQVVTSGIYHHSNLFAASRIHGHGSGHTEERLIEPDLVINFVSKIFKQGDEVTIIDTFSFPVWALFHLWDQTAKIEKEKEIIERKKLEAADEFRRTHKNLKLKKIGGLDVNP